MKFELLEKETIYRGRAFHVRQDKVRLPDGRDRQLDVVEHQPAVTLVPLDDEGMLWFIHQYRHPAGQILLELPAGVVEPGEAPRHCAQRELREEIGMAANEMAKDPEGIKKHFLPKDNRILHATRLLEQDSVDVLRFIAPKKPGIYPYLCTFPAHWIPMRGQMIVK